MALVTWLVDFTRDQQRNLAFDKRQLAGGSILVMIQDALVKRRERQMSRNRLEQFIRSGLVLDHDRRQEDGPLALEGEALARREDLELFYQRPCYEASLVRLHPNMETQQFPSTTAAKAALARHWPEMAESRPIARNLRQRFSLEDIHRVANHDPNIARLLVFFEIQ